MSYFSIHDWMTTGLNLKGNELILYALIFSFGEKGRAFTGSYSYISKVTGINNRTNVSRNLKKLVDKNLVTKDKNNKGCIYRLVPNQYSTSTESVPVLVPNQYQTSTESVPNNKLYKNNNKYISTQLENELNYEYPSEEEISRIMSD